MISEFHCSVWAWLYVVALLKALLQAWPVLVCMPFQSRDRGAYIGSDLAEAGLGNWLENKVSWATSRARWAWRTQVDIVMAIAIVTEVDLEQREEVDGALDKAPGLLM